MYCLWSLREAVPFWSANYREYETGDESVRDLDSERLFVIINLNMKLISKKIIKRNVDNTNKIIYDIIKYENEKNKINNLIFLQRIELIIFKT